MPAAALSLSQFLFGDFDFEIAATRRVLEAFPNAHANWRPHAKSRTIAELASHLAALGGRGADIVNDAERDLAGRQPPPVVRTAQALVAIFDEGAARSREALATVDESALNQSWTMRAGPRVLIQAPRRIVLRTLFLSHMAHHRAQLGVDYRLLDVPVPGVYGPTADDA
jgi:uncharacterized damage-inducible protein DinB